MNQANHKLETLDKFSCCHLQQSPEKEVILLIFFIDQLYSPLESMALETKSTISHLQEGALSVCSAC